MNKSIKIDSMVANGPNIYSFNSVKEYSTSLVTKNWEDNMIKRMGMLTFAFWSTSIIMQRLLGSIGIHGGRSAGLMGLTGFISSAACIGLSLGITNELIPSKRSKVFSSPKKESIEFIQNTIIGLSLYTILEMRLFRTVLPSSILATGVFAPLVFKNLQSIPTFEPIATSSQRLTIQKFGKTFGCHHCGTRQLLSRRTFISDHMPPTMQANQMNRKFWRKLLGVQTKQRLYAQCQRCFSLQGSAVKLGRHVLIYHNGLQLYHFAPAIGIWLLVNSKPIKDFYERLAEDIYNSDKDVQKISNTISKWKDQFR